MSSKKDEAFDVTPACRRASKGENTKHVCLQKGWGALHEIVSRKQ